MTEASARLTAALSGRYTIERELGHGGMATVYLAHDVRHDRPVAIKVLHPELAAALGAERFLSEIKTTAKLQHPHILAVLDSGEVEGVLYYVMPFVEGESLRARLDRETQLPQDDATRIASEVMDALDYAHQRRIIHRDIKPENILLAAGHAVLADFGIAIAIDRAAGDRLTGTGIALGTPAYMSPEQALGEPHIDHRSDIYSAACVLYEMLAGEVPFRAPTGQAMIARRLSEDPTPLRVLRGTVPPSLERAVTKALARAPADRFQSAADFGAALAASRSDTASVAAPSAPADSTRRSRALITLGAVAVAAAAIWATLRPRQAPQMLDEHLIAIAPFEVLNPDHALWKQGFVDILAANLDGAGEFRTVSPSVVIRRWSGRSDRASAATIAQASGAGIAIFGRLEPAGPDSLRCTVWIDNAKTGERLGEVEFRENAERMDRLGDSLSIGIMRQLSGAAGSTRTSSLGSRSLPAIKLFLQGEQLFRRASFDSARRAYERAVAVDSSFGLAMNRLAFVLGWQSVAYDAEATRLMIAAAQFVRGLSPRDSMQLTADALWARLDQFEPDSTWWTKGQLLLRTLRDLSGRSPGDFAVWNLLGESYFHLAGALGASWSDALDAFDRAIAIDSSFGPAWVHPIAVALSRDSVSAARRYAQGLHQIRARENREDWVRVTDDVLSGALADSGQLNRRLAALSLEGIFQVWAATAKWFDAAETSIRVGRAFVAARPSGNTGFNDPDIRSGFLLQTLIDRGHFREALRTHSADLEPELPYLAAMGVIPADSANGVFDRWMREGNPSAHIALGWWAARADSTAIRRFADRARTRARSSSAPYERHFAVFELRAADAYLALARRDTSRAVAALIALPDSLCPACYAHRLTLSQLLLATGREALADSILRRELTALQLRSPAADFHWRVARGRAAERTGATDRAIAWYESAQRAYAFGDSTARSLSQQLAQRVAVLRGAAR